MKETIFYLEGRGGQYLYHFFIYNLGGLYYILNKKYNIKQPNSSVLMSDTTKHVTEPTTEFKFPIKIYMQDVLPYHREAFEIIKDKFELVEDLSKYDNYEIVSIFGETLEQNCYCDHPVEIFNFLRNLFFEYMPKFNIIPNKRIYITRKNSEQYHNGTLKRFMINEMEIMEKLKPYSFEYIQLENLSVFDKIRLFMESEIILSCNSGGLIFSMFCDKNTKIIEIMNNGTSGSQHQHYINICEILNINYNRYSNINEDINGNFNLEFRQFEEFLNSIHINKI